jgi:hypothetical protein
MRNTGDVTGGKPIAVILQSISGVSAINPSVAFYDIHGGKREVLLFYFYLCLFCGSIISTTVFGSSLKDIKRRLSKYK